MRDLAPGPRRFVELQRVLPGISTEQLRSRLNRMVADGLLTRRRYREVPPRVDYELTERARDLLPVVGALARWGYEWAWSPPRPGERVDIGAILRAAPGMLAPDRRLHGKVECVVETARGEDHAYLLAVTAGRVEIVQGSSHSAEARIRGSARAWVAALGPAADAGSLHLEGDRELAEAILGELTAAAGPRAERAA